MAVLHGLEITFKFQWTSCGPVKIISGRKLDCQMKAYINQSNFYSAYIPVEARLSGTTAESVFNSKIKEAVW